MACRGTTDTAEFKLSVAEAARRLDVGENLLRAWRKAFLAKGDAAFPGHGNPAGSGLRTSASGPSGIC